MKIEEEEINIHEIAMTKEKAAELLAKNWLDKSWAL
jgi:hypothetical protein